MMAYFAVRTRGYKNDYEWVSQVSGSQNACRTLGQILDDSVPGFILRKNSDETCEILIGGIIRPEQKDYRGRKIAMQIFIGGIKEVQARSIAAAVLDNWEQSTGNFPIAVKNVTGEEKREWDADWNKLTEFVEGFPLLPETHIVINDCWEDGTEPQQKQECLATLKTKKLSSGAGLKIYWGGSPNTSAFCRQLQQEADRFYWNGGTKKELHRETIDTIPKPKQPTKGEYEVSKKVMWGMTAVIILLLFMTLWGGCSNRALKQENNLLKTSVQTLQKELKNLQAEHEKLKADIPPKPAGQ